jgi:hypothetical protein
LASFLALARLKFHKDPRSSKKQLQDRPTAKLRRKTSLQDFKYLQVKQGGRTPWQPRAFKTVSARHANDFEPVEQHGGQRVRGRTKLYMFGGLSTYISSLACWCLNIDQSGKNMGEEHVLLNLTWQFSVIMRSVEQMILPWELPYSSALLHESLSVVSLVFFTLPRCVLPGFEERMA